VKDPQARRFSNPEVAIKHFARTERPFFKHRSNDRRKFIRQGPFGSGIVKQIHFPLVKAFPPVPYCQ
jgi:hypothetical protein